MRAVAFWASSVHRSNRYYLNMPSATKTNSSWGQLLSEIAGYYLVPATQVAEPARATVVLSWGRKPARAGLRLASSVKLPASTRPFRGRPVTGVDSERLAWLLVVNTLNLVGGVGALVAIGFIRSRAELVVRGGVALLAGILIGGIVEAHLALVGVRSRSGR